VRLLVPLIACLLLAAGCGEDDDQAARPGPAAAIAELTVVVDRDGDGPDPARTRRRTCEVAADCPALAAVTVRDLKPTPGNVACTELYGGPQTGRVTGTLHGREVDARFSRVNGCEIARWQAATAILGMP
jgi:hypothetical protein